MKKWICLSITAIALAVICFDDAMADTVATGCAAPRPLPNARYFYVDPENGSMANDGSLARPWSTLANVLNNRTSQKGMQVTSGDVIYLLGGDHGNVQINGAINKEFIVIKAADGHVPTLRSLRVNGSSRWMFEGLKIQGAGDGSTRSLAGSALIDIGRNTGAGLTQDIILTKSSISTVDDTSAWTDQDWVRKPFKFGLLSSATCVSITENHFFNLRDAIQFDGDKHFVVENKFDNFGNDAIDVIASNAVIKANLITQGRHGKSETLHPDGIQGWTKNGATNTNVLIDGNIIVKTGDPKISEMQGIGIYDGKWDRLTISNNVVITNHWHGIAVAGATNSTIINNTVIAHDPTRPTWITVYNSKNEPPAKNVVVRNNIVTRLVYPEAGVIVDHNVIADRIETVASGRPLHISNPGSFGDNNIIDPAIYKSFVKIDHNRGQYDLRLKAGSPAVKRGSSKLAPEVDILGKKRKAPVDIGAYAY